MNGKANVGIFHKHQNKAAYNHILAKIKLGINEMPSLLYFNNRKTSYRKCARSFSDFKSSFMMIEYCLAIIKQLENVSPVNLKNGQLMVI